MGTPLLQQRLHDDSTDCTHFDRRASEQVMTTYRRQQAAAARESFSATHFGGRVYSISGSTILQLASLRTFFAIWLPSSCFLQKGDAQVGSAAAVPSCQGGCPV